MADQNPLSNSSDLLQEDRRFPPSDAFRAAAVANDEDVYARAERDPEGFWASFAAELEWFTPWTQVLDWKPPHAKWFVGGTLNASVNCVDRHVRGPRRNKAAIIWEGEPGDRRTLTYFDLYRQVSQFANVLKSLGVKKGDRVALYLPLIPELAIAMLACARIGAVHSVVFGGFSAESLRDRINDAQATLLVTADGGWRRGQVVPLKQMADEALEGTPSIKNVVVVQRLHGAPVPVHVKEGRDHWYHRLMQDASLRRASPSAWTPRTCSTSSTRPARRGSRRASSTRPAAIWSAPTRPRSGSSISRKTTSTGARPTSAG